MVDSRFFLTGPPLSPQEAARIAGAELIADGARLIARAADLESDDLSDAVAFVETEDKTNRLVETDAALWLLSKAAAGRPRAPSAVAVMQAPRLGFCRIAARLHRERPLGEAKGVDPAARLGEGCSIHETSVIGPGAEIGDRVRVGPGAVIGPGVVIGAECEVGAGVVIAHSLIGRRCAFLPGATVGQAGFGFVPSPDGLMRMPQLGRVVIADDVEIGANTTVDRGALGDTFIATGVKIDNLVQIGHNVRIGRFSVIAAQAGVSGSTVIGERVLIGGQVGLADHLTIGDRAQLAAQSGHMRDVPAGAKWGGSPGRPIREFFREVTALTRLAAKKERAGNEH